MLRWRVHLFFLSHLLLAWALYLAKEFTLTTIARTTRWAHPSPPNCYLTKNVAKHKMKRPASARSDIIGGVQSNPVRVVQKEKKMVTWCHRRGVPLFFWGSFFFLLRSSYASTQKTDFFVTAVYPIYDHPVISQLRWSCLYHGLMFHLRKKISKT